MLDLGSVQAGVDAVSNAGTDFSQFASSSGNFWDTGIEFSTNAFDWLNGDDGPVQWMQDNPETTKLLAGVAGGVGSYFNAKEQREHEERLMDKKFSLQQEASRITPGKGGNSVGVDGRSITRGLLTHGLIANRDDREVR